MLREVALCLKASAQHCIAVRLRRRKAQRTLQWPLQGPKGVCVYDGRDRRGGVLVLFFSMLLGYRQAYLRDGRDRRITQTPP